MPYSSGYTDPRFTGAKPLGQFNSTQTLQTPSHLEDKAMVLGKEIKGGHLVKYKSLLTENTYSGILNSRRQVGMLVYVELNDDDTALNKFYFLKNFPGHNIADWEELNFTVEASNEVHVVDDLAGRDAILTKAEGDLVVVIDARTSQEVIDNVALYSKIYAWNGTEWKVLELLGDLQDFHAQNTDIQLIRQSTGEVITADWIYSEIISKAEIDDTITSTEYTWSSDKISKKISEGIEGISTYTKQEIDQKDSDTLKSSKTYTDEQIALIDQYQAGHGIIIDPVAGDKDIIKLDLNDVAQQGTVQPSWAIVLHDGKKFYVDSASLQLALSPVQKKWAGTPGQQTFTLVEADLPIIGVLYLSVGGSLQSLDHFTITTTELTLDEPLEADVEVVLSYLKSSGSGSSDVSKAYVDAEIAKLRDGNQEDTFKTLREGINALSAPELIDKQRNELTAPGNTNIFTLPYEILRIEELFINESYQVSGFSHSGTQLILDHTPLSGDVIKIGYLTYQTTLGTNSAYPEPYPFAY